MAGAAAAEQGCVGVDGKLCAASVTFRVGIDAGSGEESGEEDSASETLRGRHEDGTPTQRLATKRTAGEDAAWHWEELHVSSATTRAWALSAQGNGQIRVSGRGASHCREVRQCGVENIFASKRRKQGLTIDS